MEPLYEILEPAPGDAEADVIEPTEEEKAEFKGMVTQWLALDDQIRKLTVAARERRTRKQALSNAIQAFMIEHAFHDVSTQQGRITSSVRTVKVPAKLKDIKQRLIELKGDSEGNHLVKQIFEDDRPTVERKSLRRIIPRVHMSLDL
jgi:uncharacterized membrane protein YheB (UPF0754 family)